MHQVQLERNHITKHGKAMLQQLHEITNKKDDNISKAQKIVEVSMVGRLVWRMTS